MRYLPALLACAVLLSGPVRAQEEEDAGEQTAEEPSAEISAPEPPAAAPVRRRANPVFRPGARPAPAPASGSGGGGSASARISDDGDEGHSLGGAGISKAEPERPDGLPPMRQLGGDRQSPKSGTASSRLPPDLQGLRWRVYERLGEVPRPASYTGGHGYGNMASGEGIAVGFLSAASGRNGKCAIGESPATPPNSPGCKWNAWISETPGGPPLKDSCIQAGGLAVLALVNWASAPHPSGRSMCELKASTGYYCNVAGCRGLISSPLGVEDYTRAERLALAVGKSCNVPGSGAVGAFGPDGVCRCQTARCEELHRLIPTLPRCTNEVRRMNGVCYTCNSMHPAGCGSPNKLVEDCAMTCRP